MRFTLTMPDDLVEQIDEEAERTGTPRAEWIRQACTDALHPPAPGPTPEEHRGLMAEVQAMTTRADYLEQTIYGVHILTGGCIHQGSAPPPSTRGWGGPASYLL